ncbi:MAG: PilZ domain-containing protein [Shewanella xiamenensis]|nr:PilZ domain-containing protein [Shewanella xiamenensis]
MVPNSEFERRSSARLDMEKHLITLRWQQGSLPPQQRDVVCLDVSTGGLLLELDTPLPHQSLVEVQFNTGHEPAATYMAEVLRCEQQQHGWFSIGLKFLNKNNKG